MANVSMHAEFAWRHCKPLLLLLPDFKMMVQTLTSNTGVLKHITCHSCSVLLSQARWHNYYIYRILDFNNL